MILKTKLGKRIKKYFKKDNPKAIIQRDINIVINGYDKYCSKIEDIDEYLS